MKVNIVFNSDDAEMNMVLIWIKPLIKAEVYLKDTRLMLKVFLFNKKIMHRPLRRAKQENKGTGIVKFAEPEDVHMNVQYGFRDPFVTGIACGAVNASSQFINIDSFKETANFLTDKDYIYLNADAKVNLGLMFVRFFKSKLK
jgi:hypothetical protein